MGKGNKSVPYRNHKLTMLMQDSLGGSAKTLMFVNCSPAASNAEETQISLKWATRARRVENSVKRNADSKEVARLKQVITLRHKRHRKNPMINLQQVPLLKCHLVWCTEPIPCSRNTGVVRIHAIWSPLPGGNIWGDLT